MMRLISLWVNTYDLEETAQFERNEDVGEKISALSTQCTGDYSFTEPGELLLNVSAY